MATKEQSLRWHNYYLKNKKTCNKRNRLWYQKNKEKVFEHKTKWAKKNPLKVLYNSLKTRCQIRNIILEISQDEFLNWFTSQKQVCIYCNISKKDWLQSKDPMSKFFKSLQIERFEPSKGYVIGNIGFACPRCNTIKSNLFSYSQMKKIGKIVHESRKHL